MDENLFEYNGKKYKVQYGGSCTECAFSEENCYALKVQNKKPPCSCNERKDKKGVIFIG